MRLASFLRICLLLVSRHRHLRAHRCLCRSTSARSFANGFGAHAWRRKLRRRTVSALRDIRASLSSWCCLQRRLARIDDDVILVIDDALELAGGHVEHEADARRHAFEEPDVRDRHGQFDVAHAFAAHARERHFDAATIADDALVLDALVFSAGAFPVRVGPKMRSQNKPPFSGLNVR